MPSRISIIPGTSHHAALPAFLRCTETANAMQFHQTMPQYHETPLVSLPALAESLGVQSVVIKDESHRFGLKSFKALGASYAIALLLSAKLGFEGRCLPYQEIIRQKHRFQDLVFVTATDGNHGKGVAWAASVFGCKAVVYMPKGSKSCRADAIRAINDTSVTITNDNYDDTVRIASAYADQHGYTLVQDTGFAGYEAIPRSIAQGYTTMAAEALTQCTASGIEKPTHMILQAGVGSMAGGVLGYMTDVFGGTPPITMIAEPDTVACFYESALHGGGKPRAVPGLSETIMAGLNCGEPNPLIWPVIRDYASFYAACPDEITMHGMRLLGHPAGGDPPVISGESAAVGAGLLSAVCRDTAYAAHKQLLGLNQDSVILLFSTEGDTDPEHYQAILSQDDSIKS